MKRFLSTLSLLCICILQSYAQKVDSDKSDEIRIIREKGITTRMAYCDYENLYDARQYVHLPGDPYSPVGAGIASFFITGLGQILNEQTGKGIGMMLGDIGLITGGLIIGITCADVQRDATGKVIKRTTNAAGTAGLIVGLAGSLAINIWSICDAVHVAKIKNLYARDCRLLYSSLDVKLFPNLAMATTAQGTKPAPGLALSIVF